MVEKLTSLHDAILNSSTIIFHLLLDSGANPLLKYKYGSTALHISAAEGAKEECKKLLAHPHAKILVINPVETNLNIFRKTKNINFLEIKEPE